MGSLSQFSSWCVAARSAIGGAHCADDRKVEAQVWIGFLGDAACREHCVVDLEARSPDRRITSMSALL